MAGPDLDSVNALIFAAMSEFIEAPLEAIGPLAGLRAASRVPRGVEEAVILAMEEGMVLSEATRGGEDNLESEGLARGGEASSSGEVGGEGESSGLVGSSLESDMAAAGGRDGAFVGRRQ
jgi:hypothetical protein